jgi:hypothetical protein
MLQPQAEPTPEEWTEPSVAAYSATESPFEPTLVDRALSAAATGDPAQQAQEERTAGASYTLPANPFGDLMPEALEHFIECTLYEEPDPQPVEPQTGTASEGEGRAGEGPSGHPASAATAATPAAEPEAPSITATPIVAASRPATTRRAGLWLFACVAAVVGLAAGYALHGFTEKRRVERFQPGAALLASSPTRCFATIVSQPPGASVAWAGSPLGTTPVLNAPVPCGEAMVTLDRPRYRHVEKRLVASFIAPATLSEQMVRPTCRLSLESTPPGATFTVAGETLGEAPLTTEVPAYERVLVGASLAGHRPAVEKVYAAGAEMNLHFKLHPVLIRRNRPARPAEFH